MTGGLTMPAPAAAARSQKARTSANSRWCYFRDAEENLFGLKERPEHRAR
jgi:hypothetical protein